VTEAGEGGAAIAEIERARAAGRPYDVVLADCRMPAPDAIAIEQHLRNAAGGAREAMVLMLTADDLPARLGRLRDLGFGESARCRHLVKPIRHAELLSVVVAARSGAARSDISSAYRNGDATGVRAADGSTGSSIALRPATHDTAAFGGRPRRILLAEDSPDNRLVIEAYLKNTSYIIDHAENGELAVRMFMAGSYDAVLMDIQMPVMDGYAAVAEIRRWERKNHRSPTPIIALTASAHDEAARRSLKMGCDAHVTKPVKRSTLVKAIEAALEPPAQGKPPAQHEAPASNDPPALREPSAASAAANGSDVAGGSATSGPIVVHLDEELSDLVPGFLARKREDTGAILSAAERGDGEAISRLGHKLKGEGGGYGLDAISDLGRKLEQAAAGGDFDAARRLAHDLVSFLDRLEIVYQPMEE
jgi:CheY-like chemotaxis protein/HPt (histidine-containing phosphotransfer) domain-containing protein